MDRQNYYRGNFNIVISPPPPVPANDTCATAIPLPFAGGSVSGDNSGATTTSLLPPSCSSMSRDVWYSYTGGATPRLVTLSTCSGTTPGSTPS